MEKSARSLARTALRHWREGRDFADKIVGATFAPSGLSAVDRAFALELFYGVLRNLALLDFWISRLRDAPVDANARDLLRLGLYQILLIETAAHAAVFETVELAPPRTRGLVNALLRRALREKDALKTIATEQPLAVRFSEPDFLIEKWTQQFGAATTGELCRWNNQPAVVHARTNLLKISAADFAQEYPKSVSLGGQSGFVDLPDPARALARGHCYLQDPSTALAAELLAPTPNETVLDACAAPGGKSAYLAGLMENRGTLISADRDAARLDRLRGNLSRLGVVNARIARCDWLDPASIRDAAFPPESFDKILLDVPCSNTGVMRRRVDVRWRLRPDDLVRLPAQQLGILRAAAPLLKPGGSLVYSTCSLEPQENEAVVAAFLQEHPAFSLTNSERSLPWRDGADGAFAARLHRPLAME